MWAHTVCRAPEPLVLWCTRLTPAPAGSPSAARRSPLCAQPPTLSVAAPAHVPSLPPGPLPHQQYADLYREAGSDGVGAMGSEPTCTLFTFALAAGTADAAGTAGEAQQGQRPLLRLVHTLSCQPHKLLTCHLQPPPFGAQEPPTPDTHLPEGGRGAGAGVGAPALQQQDGAAISPGPTLLLGLTDDVDCAVVAVTCSSGSDGDGSSSDAQGGAAGAGFVVQHVSSIPAMAYVAAGAPVAAAAQASGAAGEGTLLLTPRRSLAGPQPPVPRQPAFPAPTPAPGPAPGPAQTNRTRCRLLPPGLPSLRTQARCSASSCCLRRRGATSRPPWWRPASTATCTAPRRPARSTESTR